MGRAHNPNSWLARSAEFSEEQLSQLAVQAFSIKTLIETFDRKPAHTELLGENELVGGPKSAEIPSNDVTLSGLFDEIDISQGLRPSQVKGLRGIILKNQEVFGLDGRLGHYPAKVEIPLKEGAKEISLPPFFTSPKSREIINKQMDKWLKLEVIEPSKSPWGAPAFIVYRGEKPRMVVDFRRLNEHVIPDEFPLPRQEDILKTLTRSHWLSTLDALAGFTQLEITEKDREKTAFRTHRELFQFLKMPFGYQNGPAVFQRIMQNVLAPYL